jgi:hypothetical protein
MGKTRRQKREREREKEREKEESERTAGNNMAGGGRPQNRDSCCRPPGMPAIHIKFGFEFQKIWIEFLSKFDNYIFYYALNCMLK